MERFLRDKSRIFRITQKLSTMWRYTGEDQRFFQLLSNLGFEGDLFYFEDDKLEEILDKKIKELNAAL